MSWMTLNETLTAGNFQGVFSAAEELDISNYAPWKMDKYIGIFTDMSAGVLDFDYMLRSGDKLTRKGITGQNVQRAIYAVYAKNYFKWQRLADIALEKYNIVDNVSEVTKRELSRELTENNSESNAGKEIRDLATSSTLNGKDERTDALKAVSTDDNTEQKSGGTTQTQKGTNTTTQKPNTTNTKEKTVAAFDTSDYNADEKITETESGTNVTTDDIDGETTLKDTTKTKIDNTNTTENTGTQTIEKSEETTGADTGTISTENEKKEENKENEKITENYSRSGNIGTVSASELLMKEKEAIINTIATFWEEVYGDFDKALTIPVWG